MSRISLILILIVGTIILTATATQEKRKPNKWIPIYGITIKGAKMYYDTNSFLVTKLEDGSSFNSTEILISFDKPIEVTVSDKKYMVRSMVRELVSECTIGLTSPVFDAYFNEKIPIRKNKPITGREYQLGDKDSMIILPKTSPLYSVMCPTYI